MNESVELPQIKIYRAEDGAWCVNVTSDEPTRVYLNSKRLDPPPAVATAAPAAVAVAECTLALEPALPQVPTETGELPPDLYALRATLEGALGRLQQFAMRQLQLAVTHACEQDLDFQLDAGRIAQFRRRSLTDAGSWWAGPTRLNPLARVVEAIAAMLRLSRTMYTDGAWDRGIVPPAARERMQGCVAAELSLYIAYPPQDWRGGDWQPATDLSVVRTSPDVTGEIGRRLQSLGCLFRDTEADHGNAKNVIFRVINGGVPDVVVSTVISQVLVEHGFFRKA